MAPVCLRSMFNIPRDWTIISSFWSVIHWRRGDFWIDLRNICHNYSIIKITIAANGNDPIKCGVGIIPVLIILFNIRSSNA